VRDDRADERHRDRDEQPRQQPLVERQLERVEADVVPELRVGHAERLGVQEQLDLLPVGLRRRARDQPDEHGDADREDPHPPHHDGAVARHRVVRSGHRHEHRPGPVREEEVQRDDAADHGPDGHEQSQAGEQDCAVDVAEFHLAEPQPVHVGVEQPRSRDETEQEHYTHDEQYSAAPGQFRQSDRRPCGHEARSWIAVNRYVRLVQLYGRRPGFP
jgi:hypothetical protein